MKDKRVDRWWKGTRCAVCGVKLTDETMWVDEEGLLCPYHARLRRLYYIKEAEKKLMGRVVG